MKFSELLEIVGDEPLFETGFLLAGDRDPRDIRRQLSRWVRAGRLHSLRRGLYALAPPFRKVRPHPFLVANRLRRGSYVSRQSALAHHGVIPEHVAIVTSVGAGRPQVYETPLGDFEYRHLHKDLVRDFEWVEIAPRQWAFVAGPEKALLDLVYLEPGADSVEYLREMRLNLELLDQDRLRLLAEKLERPKLVRTARLVNQMAEEEDVYEAI